MKHLHADRWPLTVFGSAVFFCACIGCNALELTPKWKREGRVPTMLPGTLSASHKNGIPPSPSTTDIKQTSAVENDRDSRSGSSKQLGKSPDEFIELKITDAIETALGQNLHLRVISNLSEEGEKQAEIERAAFDPTINASMQYAQGEQQVASALQAVQGGQSQYSTTAVGPVPGSPNLISIEQRYSTGTVARASIGTVYNLTNPIGQFLIYNPAFQTAASLVVEQALFRSNSQRANLAGIHIAQTSQKQTVAEFQVEINQTLSDLQRSYWNAWLSESQFNTSKEFVNQAQTTFDLEKKRMELGEGGIVQFAQAKEHLNSLKAELAMARQKARAARNNLLSLMGSSLADQRPLKLTDDPLGEHLIPDLNQGLSTAVQLRPELQVRQYQIQQAQLELERRKNAQLADVRAYAGYSLTGLNGSYIGSIDKFDSGHYGIGSLGIRYSYVFGEPAARAAVDQAQLAYSRQVRAREETEFLIQQQVRDAYDGVNASWEVYRCQQERVAAARVQADTLNHLHAAGQIDLDRLLRARQQLASAVQQSNSALIDYNMSINAWRLAIGTMTIPLTSPEAIEQDRSKDSNNGSESERPHQALPPAPSGAPSPD